MTPTRSALLAALLLTLPGVALAHPGHDSTLSLAAGFAHPWAGWDHLLAMLGVGLWAWQCSGRARWLLPLAFVGAATLGAIAGRLGLTLPGLTLPGLEAWLAVSLLALGVAIASAQRPATTLALATVALFGAAHGWAHGGEMPAQTSTWGFMAGFVGSTALLHGLGLAAGDALQRLSQHRLLRGTGLALAGAGLFALAAG